MPDSTMILGAAAGLQRAKCYLLRINMLMPYQDHEDITEKSEIHLSQRQLLVNAQVKRKTAHFHDLRHLIPWLHVTYM